MMVLETSQERVHALKSGLRGTEIEELYLKYNKVQPINENLQQIHIELLEINI